MVGALLSMVTLVGAGVRWRMCCRCLVRDSPTAAAGFALGDDASWWAMLVYTGYTLVSLTITNTPQVRAALPASQRASPLSPQSALFAPPASSGSPTATATSPQAGA